MRRIIVEKNNDSILSPEIIDYQKQVHSSIWEYAPHMEVLSSNIDQEVVAQAKQYDYTRYTASDVRRALENERCSIRDFQALLSPAAKHYLEDMAQKAQNLTRRQFGNSIYMFTPLYLANYCESYCVYCGFNCHNKIKRSKLNREEMQKEMEAIASSGLEEVLILTGESRHMSGVEYIGEACKLASKYFRVVGLEVYPMNSDEYAYLHECGADYITVFQETYNPEKYGMLHLGGEKRIFPYRLNTQERAVRGGMRGVGFAALLGLDDFRKDAFATGYHAYLLQRKYPHSDIAFSCPRLRPIASNNNINALDVHEAELLQVIMAYRIFMPFANITISTRESASFRDQAIKIAATKISAGVSVGIGERTADEEHQGAEQFEIADTRGVSEVLEAIKKQGLQPVMSDYIYV